MKYLDIHLTKHAQVCMLKICIALMQETKGDKINGETCHVNQIKDLIKMSTFTKLTHRFDATRIFLRHRQVCSKINKERYKTYSS